MRFGVRTARGSGRLIVAQTVAFEVQDQPPATAGGSDRLPLQKGEGGFRLLILRFGAFRIDGFSRLKSYLAMRAVTERLV